MRNIKLRYYLRGLGVGMLITAVIMGVALPGKEQKLTDAQIREKALALGMVDGDSLVLSDLQQNQAATSLEVTQETEESVQESEGIVEATEADTDRETIESEQPTEEIPTEESVTTESVIEESIAEESTTEDTTVEEPIVEESEELVVPSESQVAEDLTSQPRVSGALNEEGNTVTIEIRSGANSYSVSRILAEYGLVVDAKSFDNYLCNNGYSKKIHTGKYLIAVGTAEEEIAKIITGNR